MNLQYFGFRAQFSRFWILSRALFDVSDVKTPIMLRSRLRRSRTTVHFGRAARRKSGIFLVVLPHFGFRARFLRFWTRSEGLLNVPDEVTPKFSARAPGARELEFILVVMCAKKCLSIGCDFAAFCPQLPCFWVHSGCF